MEHRPQVVAEHRIKADGRLVEHQQVRSAEQGDRKADPRELTAGERADQPVFQALQVEFTDGPGDGRSQAVPSQAEDGAEVAQVFIQREIG